MRSIISLALSSVVASSLTLIGCGGAPADSTESTSEALSTLGRSIVGEWDRADGNGPVDITLQNDNTYFADDQVLCVRAPCPPVRTKGAWSLSSTSSTRGTLRLFPASGGSKSYALTYASSGPVLTLSANGSVTHFHHPAPTGPQTCGGIAAIQCPAGETCVLDDGPTHPDQAGKCYPRGARGTMCGGIAGFPCDAGLTCVLTDPTIADSAGVCSARGDHGTMCGGIAALPCNDGLTCVITATFPDAAGVCSTRGELGTACGGIAGFPCNAGLVCKITDTGISDPMGVCVAAP